MTTDHAPKTIVIFLQHPLHAIRQTCHNPPRPPPTKPRALEDPFPQVLHQTKGAVDVHIIADLFFVETPPAHLPAIRPFHIPPVRHGEGAGPIHLHHQIHIAFHLVASHRRVRPLDLQPRSLRVFSGREAGKKIVNGCAELTRC